LLNELYWRCRTHFDHGRIRGEWPASLSERLGYPLWQVNQVLQQQELKDFMQKIGRGSQSQSQMRGRRGEERRKSASQDGGCRLGQGEKASRESRERRRGRESAKEG
jgi:hypothetical protein